jgi:hypothetical protein
MRELRQNWTTRYAAEDPEGRVRGRFSDPEDARAFVVAVAADRGGSWAVRDTHTNVILYETEE